MDDNEFIATVKKIELPQEMLRCLIDNIDRGIFSHDSYFADLKHVVVQQARDVLTARPENYPDPWESVRVHINRKTGEVHCDGDDSSVQYIKERMHANGKIHDTLQSIDALDNLSLVSSTASVEELLKYVSILVADWTVKRPNIVPSLCVVCGKICDLNSNILHPDCLEKVSKTGKIFLEGSIVKLRKDLLGNKAGTVGVCYNTYQIGNHQGSGFIFENGNHDGFSPDEQLEFLRLVGQSAEIAEYQFTNVIQLSADFGAVDSMFKKAFEYINRLI